jgi:hypothetical protein
MLIPYEVRTGAQNMQIDSDLLDMAIAQQRTEPIFRLYGWSPACVSLGRNQKDDFLYQRDSSPLNNCRVQNDESRHSEGNIHLSPQASVSDPTKS